MTSKNKKSASESPEDAKIRLVQEARYLVNYIVSNGVQAQMPEGKQLALLDNSDDELRNVEIQDVIDLRLALAKSIQPNFPETVIRQEKWLQDGTDKGFRRFLSRIAPLPSILTLFVTTFVLVICLALGLGVSFSKLPDSYSEAYFKVHKVTDQQEKAKLKEAHQKVPYFDPVISFLQGPCRFSEAELIAARRELDAGGSKAEYDETMRAFMVECQELRRPLMLRMFMFFGLLGMLGAAYAALHDSFNYLRENRYDTRLVATYYVRILLGGFSGVLLAEPLSDYLDQAAFSSVLLAFVGGFSAQLVYDLLNKLVEAVGSMFRADRRKEVQDALASAELSLRAALQSETDAQRDVLVDALKAAQAETDPAKRAALLEAALLQSFSTGSQQTPNSETSEPSDDLARRMADMNVLLEISQNVADHLPDANPDAGQFAAQARGQLAVAMDELARDPSDGTRATATSTLATAAKADLADDLLRRSVNTLAETLDVEILGAVARSALRVSSALKAGDLARWRYVAYGAQTAGIGLLAGLDPDQISFGPATASGQALDIGEVLSVLRTGGRDALFEAHTASFVSRAAFDETLSAWIDVTARERLSDALAQDVEGMTGGALTVEAYISGLDEIGGNATARGAMQALELLGTASTHCADPDAARARLVAGIDAAINREGAP